MNIIFGRIIVLDLKKDKVDDEGNTIFDLGIVGYKYMDDFKKDSKPHIEISYQFLQKNESISIGDSIDKDEEKIIANIIKDIFAYRMLTTYIMFDLYNTTPILDNFLNKYGYSDLFKEIKLMDFKTVCRDNIPPPYTLRKLAYVYELEDFYDKDNLAIDNAKLLLKVIFNMVEENKSLHLYINLLGYLEDEGYPGYLPNVRCQTIPQNSNDLLYLYKGFDYKDYKFKSLIERRLDSIYIVEKDSKFGLGIITGNMHFNYHMLLDCEFDNIFMIDYPKEEDTDINDEFSTEIYSLYFILVKDGKQGLCRVQYNAVRPRLKEEFKIYMETDMEYDYISPCGYNLFILHKGNEKQCFNLRYKSLSETFNSYELVDYKYLIIRRNGTIFLWIFSKILLLKLQTKEKSI